MLISQDEPWSALRARAATGRLGDLVRSGGAMVFVNQSVEALPTQHLS